jgi:hypothetical protein
MSQSQEDYRVQEYLQTPSPPCFKCNVLRENLSVDSQNQRLYIYIDPRRGPPVRLAWLEADCNTLGGGKTGY